MKEVNIEYLQMIQNAITRMAENSFKIKGWAIGIMLAIFSFAGGQGNKRCILFTVIPLFVLWCLDSYYLQMERKYRKFYDFKRSDKESNDFDMNYNNMKIEMRDISKVSYFRSMFSITELLFYLVCIATSVAVYLI